MHNVSTSKHPLDAPIESFPAANLILNTEQKSGGGVRGGGGGWSRGVGVVDAWERETLGGMGTLQNWSSGQAVKSCITYVCL